MEYKIKDLKTKMINIDLVANVIKKEDFKTSSTSLSKAILFDGSGEITLNLWREQTKQCKVGDLIKITAGFTKMRFANLELSTWNNIIVIEKGA